MSDNQPKNRPIRNRVLIAASKVSRAYHALHRFLHANLLMVALIVVVLVFIFSSRMVFHIVQKILGFNLAEAGLFGDFFGGYVGSVFALISVFLLYIAYQGQQKAADRQSFENRFFELLKLHQNNVEELELGGERARRVFVLLMHEWSAGLERLRAIDSIVDSRSSKETLAGIAYVILLFGTGPRSEAVLKKQLRSLGEVMIWAISEKFGSITARVDVKRDNQLPYLPFEGHLPQLGHYYRTLYQIVRYVDRQIFPEAMKYEYVKTVRAQLSTHEQALLLVNSLSPVGRPWRDLIRRYRLCSNIPDALFDSESELDHISLFEPDYFEWQQDDGEPL